ncbi:protein Niban 2-like isoform X2 [Hypanus sabinus]|uniref:protein Niban 2-like isoform X2 n=1 Tax=Hypanus sabinus TaxID=79690 RepID=UPI0028C4DB00|nr:protein Niban 2-like isoform X2 [Hypanus sabinus]
MSEADCRRWIAETIEWLRSRKARPDQERICKMVQRRHGVSPSRTRRQLDRLLRSRAVLRVRYKGSHSYRNAVPGQLEPGERSGRSARDRNSGQRGPARDKSRPPAEQLSVVVTRARHKEVLEQQVARARGRKPPAEVEGEAAERRRRLPVTDSGGPERKKTRRTKEADPSESEGSDEDEDSAAPVKGRELEGQGPSEAQNEAETATDCGSEDSDTEGSPVKSPDTEGHSAEDVREEMSTEEQLEASPAVGQGTSPDPVGESETITEAEPRSESEVRLCPGSTGEAGSSDGPISMEKSCGEEPGVQQGEEDAELETLDQLGPVVCDTAGLSQCTEDRPRAAYDQKTSHQLESQTSEGRADGLLNDIRPHCHRQYAAAFLSRVWNELEPRADQGPQLLQKKEPRDADQVISSGYIMQYVESKKKWKEKYFVMKASYGLDCFENKEAAQRGLKADGTVQLSGYIPLSSVSDYKELVNQSWPVFNGVADTYLEEQHLNLPTSHHLFLWHSYKPHLLLCFHTEEDYHTWSMVLADGIRHLNTVMYGRDTFEVRALLEAVRVYREQKGHYGTCDLYLGSEVEILSNLVMEDLCPVLESQLIPHIRGAESKRKQAWLKMLGDMYAVVEAQVSAEFPALLGEYEEQRQRLERTVRPDFNQILTAKKQLVEKIQASLGERVRCFCRDEVRPQLRPVQELVAGSMATALGETRRLFSEEVSEVISKVKNGENSSTLAQVCSQLLVLPYHSVQMHHCYKKTEELEQYLSEVGPRFSFCGVHFLMHRAQNIVQQKFDSDSNAAVRQFVRDTLLELFLPFVLKSLEPVCKPELPEYEAYVSADEEGVIQLEATYKELVLHIVSGEINKATKETSTQPKFSLYNESMAYLWDNEPQLSTAEHPKSIHSTSPTELSGQSPALGTISEHMDHTESTPASGNSMEVDGI